MDLATSTGGTGYLCQPLSVPKQFTGSIGRASSGLSVKTRTRRRRAATMAKSPGSFASDSASNLIQVGPGRAGKVRRRGRRRGGRKKGVIKHRRGRIGTKGARKSRGRPRRKKRSVRSSKVTKRTARRRRTSRRKNRGVPQLPENF